VRGPIVESEEPGLREAHAVKMNEADGVFRALMRELAKRGGAATKRLAARQPGYYSAIGRLGGKASGTSRRAKLPPKLDGAATNERPIVETVAASSESPQPTPNRPLSLYKKLLAEGWRPSLNAPPARNRWDDFAEEQVARHIAQVRQRNSEVWDEPFDELG
jgi:general stress protein YciG